MVLELFHYFEAEGGISVDKMPKGFFKNIALAAKMIELLTPATQFTLLWVSGAMEFGSVRALTAIRLIEPPRQRPGCVAHIATGFVQGSSPSRRGPSEGRKTGVDPAQGGRSALIRSIAKQRQTEMLEVPDKQRLRRSLF